MQSSIPREPIRRNCQRRRNGCPRNTRRKNSFHHHEFPGNTTRGNPIASSPPRHRGNPLSPERDDPARKGTIGTMPKRGHQRRDPTKKHNGTRPLRGSPRQGDPPNGKRENGPWNRTSREHHPTTENRHRWETYTPECHQEMHRTKDGGTRVEIRGNAPRTSIHPPWVATKTKIETTTPRTEKRTPKTNYRRHRHPHHLHHYRHREYGINPTWQKENREIVKNANRGEVNG